MTQTIQTTLTQIKERAQKAARYQITGDPGSRLLYCGDRFVCKMLEPDALLIMAFLSDAPRLVQALERAMEFVDYVGEAGEHPVTAAHTKIDIAKILTGEQEGK